ncbi:hypothetical protein [Pontibacter vulgaris]|uniref:hypothetical protein n=1 Tax=Pontibacter vulgaris TaxID=2905679 RepID=UPI001FA6E2C5|nr:hypothetical protein [Pontibacter vulgaris]
MSFRALAEKSYVSYSLSLYFLLTSYTSKYTFFLSLICLLFHFILWFPQAGRPRPLASRCVPSCLRCAAAALNGHRIPQGAQPKDWKGYFFVDDNAAKNQASP